MPTSAASDGAAPMKPTRDPSAGFLMLDLLVALLVMALIAALALPLVRSGGQAGLRVKAEEIAAALRNARSAALLSGRQGDVAMDVDHRTLRSSHPATLVAIPRALTLQPSPASLTNFVFTADGRSSGGALLLDAGSHRLVIRVDPFSASVNIVAP